MNRPSILIIDDEPIIVHNMKFIFEEAGFDAVGASNAAQARACISQQLFDFIITDIRLPDANGADLIVQMHAQQPQARILIHTGAHRFELTRELQRCGITPNDVLLKPIVSAQNLAEQLLNDFQNRYQT